MELLEKSDKEIKDIAQPIWDNLVKSSNIKDYGGFTKDFSSQCVTEHTLFREETRWPGYYYRGDHFKLYEAFFSFFSSTM